MTVIESPFPASPNYSAGCAAGLFTQFDATPTVVSGGHNYRHSLASGWGLKRQVSGANTATIYVYCANHTTLLCEIDGSTATVPTFADGTLVQVSVTLPDTGSHEVYFHSSAADYLDETATLTLTGPSPAFSASAHVGPRLALYGTVPSYAAIAGWAVDAGTYIGGTAQAYDTFHPDASVVFKSLAGSAGTGELWGWIYGAANGSFRPIIDGVEQAIVTTGGTSVWNLLQLALGIDTSVAHTVNAVDTHATGQGSYVAELMIVGQAIDMGATWTTRKQWALLGDSNTEVDAEALLNGGHESSTGYPYKLGRDKNVGIVNRGKSGDTVANMLARITDITALSPVPAVVIIMGGTNNMMASGTTPDATFKSNFVSILNDILGATGFGSTQLIVLLIPPKGAVNSQSTYDAWNGISGSGGNGVLDAVAACSNPSAVKTIDTTRIGLVFATHYYSDQVHLNDAGHTVLENAILASLSSITVTETRLERGEAGQTLHVTATGLTLTAVAGDYALSNGGSVTAASLTDSTHAVLTVTAPAADGTTVLTTQSTSSAPITVSDTTAPPIPTGLTFDAPTATWSVPASWNSETDTYGGTVTYSAKHGSTIVATGIAGTAYTFAGISDGDTLSIDAVDGDGNTSSVDSVTFHAPTSGTIPAAANVRLGVAVGSTTGTLIVPLISHVLNDTTFDNGITGTAVLPSQNSVLNGVVYGVGGTGSTGDVSLPAVSFVLLDILFGPGDTFVGTYTAGTIPANSDVRSGVAVGVSGHGSLVVPSANNVATGVTFDNGTVGTITLPATSNVLLGVSYGAGGNAFTGNVVLPPASEVQTGVVFGSNSSLTGTYGGTGSGTIPAASNVRFGVAVGSGTGTLVVPTASTVLTGTTFDNGTMGNVILPATSAVESGVTYGPVSSLTGTFTGSGGGGGTTTVIIQDAAT